MTEERGLDRALRQSVAPMKEAPPAFQPGERVRLSKLGLERGGRSGVGYLGAVVKTHSKRWVEVLFDGSKAAARVPSAHLERDRDW